MIYAILAVSAVVDMGIVYGISRAVGFHPTPTAVVVGVAVCYAISHVVFFKKRG
jgi:hypothetical protein